MPSWVWCKFTGHFFQVQLTKASGLPLNHTACFAKTSPLQLFSGLLLAELLLWVKRIFLLFKSPFHNLHNASATAGATERTLQLHRVSFQLLLLHSWGWRPGRRVPRGSPWNACFGIFSSRVPWATTYKLWKDSPWVLIAGLFELMTLQFHLHDWADTYFNTYIFKIVFQFS